MLRHVDASIQFSKTYINISLKKIVHPDRHGTPHQSLALLFSSDPHPRPPQPRWQCIIQRIKKGMT